MTTIIGAAALRLFQERQESQQVCSAREPRFIADFTGCEVSFAGVAAFAHPMQLAGVAPAGVSAQACSRSRVSTPAAGRPAMRYSAHFIEALFADAADRQ